MAEPDAVAEFKRLVADLEYKYTALKIQRA